MRTKHGVTGVIFRESGGARLFLVLHRVLNWTGWEFVKGGIDGSETPEEAVFREIKEETGLEDVELVVVLPKKVSWTAKDIKYIYTPFVLRSKGTGLVKIEQEIVEHDGFKWVEESNVEPLLTHEDNKKIFREALALIGG